MARAIWKGAISFGLVHVPVALVPASSESGIDFDWLDKRSMDPVGYKRINKRTGREIDKDNIVRGIKVESGDYVVIGDDEIQAAYPKTTQTIAIEAFVKAAEIPFTLLDRPYYLEAIGKGEKVYALLREAMRDAGVIGIARVVMHSKEHLAALVPLGPALMLNTLRWASDVRSWDELNLPADGRKGANLKDAELKMARALIGDMTVAWKPDAYEDKFAAAVHKLVKKRVDAGDTETVTPMEEGEAPSASNVVDLSALLKQSLGARKPAQKAKAASATKAAAKKKAAPRKAPAGKTPTARRRA